MRKVLILGGASAIAHQTARLFAADGDKLYLVDLHADRLQVTAEDLRTRGALQVETQAADLGAVEHHAAIIEAAWNALGGLDTVLLAYGTLSKQKECEADVAMTLRELNTNYVSAVSLLSHLANRFEEQGRGTICAISSVAGDRGRRSNYVYGSAKGGLTIFLQGLRNRLGRAGVKVVTVKPGLVDTPMTAAFEKKGALWSNAESIGRGIYLAISRGKAEVYLPPFWWLVMFIIRSVPEFIFRKTNI